MTPSAEAPALSLEEAVPLLYAAVGRLAEDHGIRVLAIKGPALAEQGLRSPGRHSVDADFLVEPAGFDRLRAELEAVGWHDDGFYDTPGMVFVHSVNHRHASWPCELDAHHWFPGFLADPAVVFDALWERRQDVTIAHRRLAAPDPVAHLALLALHHLRDRGFAWGRDKFDDLVATVEPSWTPAKGEDLARLAAATGATRTLRPLLDRLGCPVLPATVPDAISYADWTLRSDLEVTEVLPWLVGLRTTPWSRRPAYVWHAVWLGDDRFVARDRSLEGSRRAVMQARWSRIRRGARALPRAWRDYRRLTGGSSDARR